MSPKNYGSSRATIGVPAPPSGGVSVSRTRALWPMDETREASLPAAGAKSVELTREELYEQVWTVPMQRLAQRYGISDVALAKTCRKLVRGEATLAPSGTARPPRGSRPRDITCHSQTPAGPGASATAPVGRRRGPCAIDRAQRHQPRRLQAPAPGRGEDLVRAHTVLTEGLAERPALRPSSLIQISLGRAVVDLETGRVAVAGRRVAMADQRDVTATDERGPGFLGIAGSGYRRGERPKWQEQRARTASYAPPLAPSECVPAARRQCRSKNTSRGTARACSMSRIA